MNVVLSATHYVYVAAIVAIILLMVRKKETAVACMLGILAVGLTATASISQALGGLFGSLIFAVNELAGTILIISVVTALCRLLEATGINARMISPFTKFIRTPASAYWLIGLVMMVVSSFFWPSPAVALIGAVFLPVALRVKLPAMGVAVAMNLFGHGIALSGDFVIKGAPKLAADGAGLPLAEQVAASIPLVIVMGLVTTVLAFYQLMKDMKSGRMEIPEGQPEAALEQAELPLSDRAVGFFALLVPALLALDVVVMLLADLQGGDATALVGGTVVFLLILIAAAAFKGQSLERVTEYLVEGFVFGFRVFGPVIPVAAFFYLGGDALGAVFGAAAVPAGSEGLVNDLGLALSAAAPVGKSVSAFSSTLMGTLTGLDGSGFSGINLAGSVARIFGTLLGHGVATLSALGQIAAIWVGGGTVIPWAVIPVAAICGVDPVELAGRNLKPVAIGLVVTTLVGIFLL
ncbi:MAG: hypothetical protein GXX99_08380 [Clostridiales bacterium]|nr:hypothetical protein [Clostridiales bacterium]